jgi:hypothetical protein
MEEGLMVQCGVPLLGYHPLISITIIRAIKLLVPVKESRKLLLLQRVQLCLNLRRERWLKFLLGYSRKLFQQLLPVSLLRLAGKTLKRRLCNCRLPRESSLLPGLLERLISTKPLWIDFAEVWFTITGTSARAFKRLIGK